MRLFNERAFTDRLEKVLENKYQDNEIPVRNLEDFVDAEICEAVVELEEKIKKAWERECLRYTMLTDSTSKYLGKEIPPSKFPELIESFDLRKKNEI